MSAMLHTREMESTTKRGQDALRNAAKGTKTWKDQAVTNKEMCIKKAKELREKHPDHSCQSVAKNVIRETKINRKLSTVRGYITHLWH